MSRSAFMLVGLLSLTAGCTGVRSKIPFYYHEPAAGTPLAPFHANAREQYFDKLHKRYYYYDPVKKAYFWENGQPKG